MSFKFFSVLLFIAVLSNSAFAMSDIEHEITMGKIDAAELATSSESVTQRSLKLVEKAKALQESVGFQEKHSDGRLSALGQMITIIELSLKEVNSLEDVRSLIEMNQALEELMQ